MSSRAALPSTLTSGATLTRSGEGVAFNAIPAPNNQIPLDQGARALPPDPILREMAKKSTANPLQDLQPGNLAPKLPAMQGTEKPPVVISPNVQTSPQHRDFLTSPAVVSKEEVIVDNGVASEVVSEKKEWGFYFNPLNIVWLVLIFIIVIIILYTTKPNMVTDLENGERVINNNKLILWTVIITIIIAVLAFVIMHLVSRRSDGKAVA